MQDTLTVIREGIVELLPDAMRVELSPSTYLHEIPQWDSMTAINFKVFLEGRFDVRIPDEFIDGQSTIGEVIDILRSVE
jgi:acyl carrier protein